MEDVTFGEKELVCKRLCTIPFFRGAIIEDYRMVGTNMVQVGNKDTNYGNWVPAAMKKFMPHMNLDNSILPPIVYKFMTGTATLIENYSQ